MRPINRRETRYLGQGRNRRGDTSFELRVDSILDVLTGWKSSALIAGLNERSKAMEEPLASEPFLPEAEASPAVLLKSGHRWSCTIMSFGLGLRSWADTSRLAGRDE